MTGVGGSVEDDRELIEFAVARLIDAARPGWIQLHGEFEPTASPPGASVLVYSTDSGPTWLPIAAQVIDPLLEHQRRAAMSGKPWQRLIVDCYPDGRLSARVEPATPISARPRRRVPIRGILIAVLLTCLALSAALFATTWRWSPPPDATADPLPAPAPRQPEVFGIVDRWFDALHRHDTAAMLELTCSVPTGDVANGIQAGGHSLVTDASTPEAIVDFSDGGETVHAKIVLSSALSPDAAAEPGATRFEFMELVLTDEGTGLKLCGSE